MTESITVAVGERRRRLVRCAEVVVVVVVGVERLVVY
jgi:hypothetical protein